MTEERQGISRLHNRFFLSARATSDRASVVDYLRKNTCCLKAQGTTLDVHFVKGETFCNHLLELFQNISDLQILNTSLYIVGLSSDRTLLNRQSSINEQKCFTKSELLNRPQKCSLDLFVLYIFFLCFFPEKIKSNFSAVFCQSYRSSLFNHFLPLYYSYELLMSIET